jgi:hypothetical protein
MYAALPSTTEINLLKNNNSQLLHDIASKALMNQLNFLYNQIELEMSQSSSEPEPESRSEKLAVVVPHEFFTGDKKKMN